MEHWRLAAARSWPCHVIVNLAFRVNGATPASGVAPLNFRVIVGRPTAAPVRHAWTDRRAGAQPAVDRDQNVWRLRTCCRSCAMRSDGHAEEGHTHILDLARWPAVRNRCGCGRLAVPSCAELPGLSLRQTPAGQQPRADQVRHAQFLAPSICTTRRPGICSTRHMRPSVPAVFASTSRCVWPCACSAATPTVLPHTCSDRSIVAVR